MAAKLLKDGATPSMDICTAWRLFQRGLEGFSGFLVALGLGQRIR